ncbi:hypothetical protein K1719_017008 [Acacia pycnantha]|nr:hypothetical protein K1719_017008 [Acacia pycnantha]
MKKQSSKKPALPLTPGRRIAMSECDCESSRDFKFTGKQEKPQAMADSSSRRAVSLRFSAAVEDLKEKNGKWEIDDENHSY